MNAPVEAGADVIEVRMLLGEAGEGIKGTVQQGEVALKPAEVIEIGGSLGPEVNLSVVRRHQGDEALVGFPILGVIGQQEERVLRLVERGMRGRGLGKRPEGGAAGVESIPESPTRQLAQRVLVAHGVKPPGRKQQPEEDSGEKIWRRLVGPPPDPEEQGPAHAEGMLGRDDPLPVTVHFGSQQVGTTCDAEIRPAQLTAQFGCGRAERRDRDHLPALEEGVDFPQHRLLDDQVPEVFGGSAGVGGYPRVEQAKAHGMSSVAAGAGWTPDLFTGHQRPDARSGTVFLAILISSNAMSLVRNKAGPRWNGVAMRASLYRAMPKSGSGWAQS